MGGPQDLSIFLLSFDRFLSNFPIFHPFLIIFFPIFFLISDCSQTLRTLVFAPFLVYMQTKMSSLQMKRSFNYVLQYDFPEIRIYFNVDKSY